MQTKKRESSREKEFLKVPEAAELLRVPRSRMYALVANGDVPAVRIGERSIRIRREELTRFLTEERAVVS
ncbi:hypothetical protein BH20ACT10_BH20ACT10_00580 [soil metagenome]|jgi:excisionase family DNA binding protein